MASGGSEHTIGVEWYGQEWLSIWASFYDERERSRRMTAGTVLFVATGILTWLLMVVGLIGEFGGLHWSSDNAGHFIVLVRIVTPDFESRTPPITERAGPALYATTRTTKRLLMMGGLIGGFVRLLFKPNNNVYFVVLPVIATSDFKSQAATMGTQKFRKIFPPNCKVRSEKWVQCFWFLPYRSDFSGTTPLASRNEVSLDNDELRRLRNIHLLFRESLVGHPVDCWWFW